MSQCCVGHNFKAASACPGSQHQVLGSSCLVLRCLNSSRESWNISLAPTLICAESFKNWKILSLRTLRGTKKPWTPVLPGTSLIPSFSAWTRQGQPGLGLGGSESGGHPTDTELVVGVLSTGHFLQLVIQPLAQPPGLHLALPQPPQQCLLRLRNWRVITGLNTLLPPTSSHSDWSEAPLRCSYWSRFMSVLTGLENAIQSVK